MDNFDLRKYLAENNLNEASGKVLVDKVEPRWIVAEPDNINMQGLTVLDPDPNTKDGIEYYKRKENAEKRLADLMVTAKVKAEKLRDNPEWYVDVPGAKESDEKYIRVVNNAEVIEVEMQVKITVK